MEAKLTLRMARPEDAAALLAVYAPYVEETAVSFEYDVPSVAEFAARIARTLEKYPYLSAWVDGEAAGYAYASPFHSRRAYGWGVETSIYVRRDLRRLGLGRALHGALEEILRLQGCVVLRGDVYGGNAKALRLYEREGLKKVGAFRQEWGWAYPFYGLEKRL